MITDSYNASCFIENDGGKYHIECAITSKDKEVYSDYDGDNFIDGVNEIIADLTEQFFKEPEPKQEDVSKEELLENKITQLEDLVTKLQAENKKLTDIVNNFSIKKTDNKKVDKATKDFNNAVNNFINNNNQKDYDDLYDWINSIVFH